MDRRHQNTCLTHFKHKTNESKSTVFENIIRAIFFWPFFLECKPFRFDFYFHCCCCYCSFYHHSCCLCNVASSFRMFNFMCKCIGRKENKACKNHNGMCLNVSVISFALNTESPNLVCIHLVIVHQQKCVIAKNEIANRHAKYNKFSLSDVCNVHLLLRPPFYMRICIRIWQL